MDPELGRLVIKVSITVVEANLAGLRDRHRAALVDSQGY